MSGTRWITSQILSIKRTAEPSRFNPRPLGVMLPGSTTDAVKAWLDDRPPNGWWTKRQIEIGTGRSCKAIDWALIYLRSIHAIECSRDDSRNARYLRYRSTHHDAK